MRAITKSPIPPPLRFCVEDLMPFDRREYLTASPPQIAAAMLFASGVSDLLALLREDFGF